MSPSNREFSLNPGDANLADSCPPTTAFPMSRRAWLTIGGTAFAAGIALPLHEAHAAEPQCATNSHHIAAFKNAQVFESPPDNIYAVKGRAVDNRVVTLHFRNNATPCKGITTSAQLVCYFEHEKWEEAKQQALANTHYFHVHGEVDAGGKITQAALSYSTSSVLP